MVRNEASHLEHNIDEELDEFLYSPSLKELLPEICRHWEDELRRLVVFILGMLLFKVIELPDDPPEFLAIDLLALDLSHLVREVDNAVQEAHGVVG